jgi:ABC-2 type transport system ATP-binding protein
MNDQDSAVVVKDLYKSFKLPHEQSSGLKQSVVNFTKRKKGYELQHVLKNVSFEIKKGEFFGIVGRNGSGKSTLLKLLAGIYTADKGLVHVNGSLTPFIELGVGFNPELTGRENVYMNGALLGFDRKEMDAMYDGIVEFAELAKFMDQKLKNYSSGMQVRLAFSIAVRANSDILLIDEVLAVGDAAFQQKCFNYFEQLKAEKRTIILVTHDMSAVKRFCTSALYLSNGKIVKQGTPSDIADMYLFDNMESLRQIAGDPKENANYRLHMEVEKEDQKSLVVKFNYESTTKDKLYVGISIQHNGMSIAEMTTQNTLELQGKGIVTYTLDKELFNAGAYELATALFNQKNREMVTYDAHRVKFLVSSDDPTRGAALKLPNTWK